MATAEPDGAAEPAEAELLRVARRPAAPLTVASKLQPYDALPPGKMAEVQKAAAEAKSRNEQRTSDLIESDEVRVRAVGESRAL